MPGTLFVTKVTTKYRQHDWTDATEYFIPFEGNLEHLDYMKLKARICKMLNANPNETTFMGIKDGILTLSETTRVLDP